MTFKEKLKAIAKILFKNKPISTMTLGVEVKKCSECEYKKRCENKIIFSPHSCVLTGSMTVNEELKEVKQNDSQSIFRRNQKD